MSAGVNVLFRLVADAARALGPAYEVEVVELHPAERDAPSGRRCALPSRRRRPGLPPRSLRLRAACEWRAQERHHRPLHAARRRRVGDHTVHFLADGERLELTHRATSRENFARGAVRPPLARGPEPGLRHAGRARLRT